VAGSWLRAWAITALIGAAMLAALFVAYEIVERVWLLPVLSVQTLFTLHIVRGVVGAILLATWGFYNVRRLRRQFDDAFAAAYAELERAMRARTDDLARAQAFNERVLDALSDRIVVIDGDGRVVKANRVATDGGRLPLVGEPCAMLGGACCETGGCISRHVLSSGQPVLNRLVRIEGEQPRMYLVDSYPLDGPSGRLAIEVARDVTVSEQLQAQMRNQEKLAALGVLAAGIAHDIANPLASLSSEIEILEEAETAARARASVKVLREHVARIGRVLREMTDFARRRTDEVSAVVVRVAIEDALRLVRHDQRARQVTFTTQYAGDGVVWMVEDHLVMALVNLILNALDAMPQGGHLTLRATTIEGHVHIAVDDTGSGMTDEVRRRAVEPLFTTKAPGRGTGLGLAIAADVVRRAGGVLDIDSTPGLGTTVHLTLPEAARA
jgi:signal transduction histidine kinase